MNYKINLASNNGTINYSHDTVSLTAQSDDRDTRFSLSVEFPEWESDAYVFLPACAYNGNRFKRIKCQYPPMYPEEDCGVNAAPVISDIPALNPDGSGKIEITTGDLSVPCFGVFFKKAKEAFFIFTEQACKNKNLGFVVESGRVTVQFPVIRSVCYRMCRTNEPSTDKGISVSAGETLSSKVLIKTFECEDIPEFFEIFFRHRKSVLQSPRANTKYTKELWDVLEAHVNNDIFSGEYIAEMSKVWQCGWVGGGMSSLPLLKYGSDLSKQQAIKTIDFMTSHVAPTGFFYSLIRDGMIKDDGFEHEHMKHSTLVRKNGDALYFLFKHFDIVEPKESWVNAARGCADAFVRLYERYNDFGLFINVETGEMMFGGTTSGASTIGALIRAWRYFGDSKYLEIAQLAGEKYYTDFVACGLTYGGPGEALCAPDSESAYAMVESMVLLYEADKNEKWLKYAKDSLHLLSSWIMPYAYEFPKGSEFRRLNINTVGSVFANAQNKHSAPGLCSASGDAIYRLYKYTGNVEYLELLRDVMYFMPQCVSTDERPIFSGQANLYSIDGSPDEDVPISSFDIPRKKLLSGWICERVNTSDWEDPVRVGEVFYGSCWPETSLLLSFMDLIWNDEISKEL